MNSQEFSIGTWSQSPQEYHDELGLKHIVTVLEIELSRPYPATDQILKCGFDCLAILKTHPQVAQLISYTRLKAHPFKDVPTCWRRLYCDAALWDATQKLKACASATAADAPPVTDTPREQRQRDRQAQIARAEFDDAIAMLDMALIMSGAPGREQLIHDTTDRLHAFLALDADPSSSIRWMAAESDDDEEDAPANPPKRRRIRSPPATPPTLVHPPLKHQIRTLHAPSMPTFQSHLSSPHGPTPIILTDTITHWPALRSRPWSDPSYLLSATLGGRRRVPIEIGRSYTDSSWGQRLMRFDEFVARFMCPGSEVDARERGYLAQHDLLSQVPRLRADVAVPDYCYCEPPPPPTDEESGDGGAGELAINAWFGPAHTVSPLHTDPHHNILAQVVGHKYVRLYGPDEGEALRPMSGGEGGVDMSNTSTVDLCHWVRVIEGWDGWGHADGLDALENDGEEVGETADEFRANFPGFERAVYCEAVIGPGDCLYIPRGWWHYVRSLSPSFSVSFWWD
jgi:lysine-specific demethylase 8